MSFELEPIQHGDLVTLRDLDGNVACGPAIRREHEMGVQVFGLYVPFASRRGPKWVPSKHARVIGHQAPALGLPVPILDGQTSLFDS